MKIVPLQENSGSSVMSRIQQRDRTPSAAPANGATNTIHHPER